ncbi:MAG: carbohydrate ABC transporter substrate-binding protein [Anaerolineales bacterium]|nr:carbohydrate ABC transporter substrate-binding protein [Anaerolineales bacterium]
MKHKLFVLMAVLLVLGACSPTTIIETVEVPGEEIIVTQEVEVIREVDTSPISVTIPWTGDAMELFLPVVEAFEAESGIEVRVLPYKTEDLGPLLPAQFMAEEPMADVMIMAWPWWIEENTEHLVDLTDLTEGIDFLGNPVVKDGAVYGIPSYLWVKGGFWYRNSIFEANGYTVPTTMEEFTALLEDMATLDGVENPLSSPDGYPLADIVEHFLAARGGPEMVQGIMDGTVKWTDPEVRAVFADDLIPLIDSGMFSDPVERHAAADLWWEGDYVLHYYGNWISEDVDDPADLRILPVPGSTSIVGGSDWMFIPKYTDRVDDAKAFIAFVISDAGMAARLEQGGRLSSRADFPLDLYPASEKALAERVSQFEVLPDLDDTIGGEWQTIFWDQISLLWVDTTALDEVLETLQANMPE